MGASEQIDLILFPQDAVLGDRCLVCGGRDYTNRFRVDAVLDAIHAKRPIVTLIHGAARGADSLARQWAIHHNIVAIPFPADWEAHGYSAGPRRNLQMLKEGQPDYVVAFPGGKGTKHMVDIAKSYGCPVIDLRSKLYGWNGSL